jgi:very-short-patch-repair endonuclease
MTESERVLWTHLRGKQLLGVQFYRQKPIDDYIVDFYSPKAKLIIEIDGSQHLEDKHAEKDRYRDERLRGLGLKVIRFNSRQVLEETEAVLEVIYQLIREEISKEIPPAPPFTKGGKLKTFRLLNVSDLSPPLKKGDLGGFRKSELMMG